MEMWLHQLRWRAGLVWSGVLLLIIGFISERSWHSLPAARVVESAVLAATAFVIAALLTRVIRIRLASSFAIVFFVVLTCEVGVLPMMATLLLAGAGLSLGCRIAGNATQGSIATIAGIGVFAGILGWLLPFPIHYRFVYFLLLSIAVFVGRKYCETAVRDGFAAWQVSIDQSPRIAAFAVLVVGLASAGCWLPTVQFDDLAYHLGLPSQLAELGYYRMDAHSQIWALAPWAGDIVQAIAQVLASAEARGAVDACWLILAAVLSWQLAAAMDAPPFARWLAVALFASLPMTAALAGGMQAELPATAVSLALALSVANVSSSVNMRHMLLFAILAGLLLALKTGFIAIIAPLTIWLVVRWWGRWSWRFVLAGFAATLAVCGSSYVYAAMLSGNPVFPLLNGLFRSPLLDPTNLADPRWTAPVGLDIPWQLTFHTRAYLEGWDGGAGFYLLGLVGAVVIAFTSSKLRPLAASAIAAFVLAISTVHYFRYTYPSVALLTPVLVAAVVLAMSQRKATILLCTLVVLDLAYQSCAYWTLHVGGIKRSLNPWESASVMERLAPERGLIRIVRAKEPMANIVFCSPDFPFAAEMAGHGFVTAYYDPELEHARTTADADATGIGWRALFARTNAHYAIASNTTERSSALSAALMDAQLLKEIGTAQLWQLPEVPSSSTDLNRERDIASARFRP
jgi:hypothetical protein